MTKTVRERGSAWAIGEPAVLGSFGAGERLRVRRNLFITSVRHWIRIRMLRLACPLYSILPSGALVHVELLGPWR